MGIANSFESAKLKIAFPKATPETTETPAPNAAPNADRDIQIDTVPEPDTFTGTIEGVCFKFQIYLGQRKKYLCLA